MRPPPNHGAGASSRSATSVAAGRTRESAATHVHGVEASSSARVAHPIVEVRAVVDLSCRRPSPVLVAAAVAVSALVLGAACYLLLRAGGAWAIPWGLGLWAPSVVAGSVPSLLHTFAFALLGAAVLGLGRAALAGSALAWVAIGVGFETLQHDQVAAALFPQTMPARGGGDALSALLARYAHGGVFDPADVAAALIGAALAWHVGRLLSERSVGTGEAQP